MKRITQLPVTKGGAARNAWRLLRASAVPAAPLLARAGLTRGQLSDDGTRISVRSQVEFLQLASEALSDKLLGFHLALEAELREAGLYYFVLASCGNLQEFLQRGARYTSLVNEGITQEYLEGAEVGTRIRFAGISRHRDRQQVEYWMTSSLRALRLLTGKHLVPTRVRMAHPRVRGSGELQRYYGCEVEFDAPVDQIMFARKARRMPLVNADPYLNKLLVAFCEQAVAHRVAGRGPMRARVENLVAPLLPHGRVTAGLVARQLGIGQRTLARHLADEGTSFSTLMNELRQDLARRYLDGGQVSVSKVAWLLGYQGVGPFSHAFKRWSGKSPRTYRRDSLK